MKPPTDHKALLVIGHQWPEPEATAAGQRMWQLLSGFREAGYHITFACARGTEKYGMDLGAEGIEAVPIRLNHSSFDQWLSQSGFDLVLFDRFLTEEQFSWRIREHLPACTLLLDTEDLHSLRHSRETAVRANREWEVSDWLENPLFYRELASIIRCDLSLIISRAEMDLLLTHLPFLEGKLCYLPFRFPRADATSQPGFGQRQDFVFVGNGKHNPNLDAIPVLKSAIWPELRQHFPKASLRIYGAYLPESILRLDAPEDRFEVRGWAKDLEAVFTEHRLQLAPLRFGAGVKGKILNGLRFGMPTLSTPVGWEGICQDLQEADFIAEPPEAFIRKAVRLYTCEATWRDALQKQMRASTPHFGTSLRTLLESLEGLKEAEESGPQAQKVLQKLLRHQAFDRLRYLSKWIEAKEGRGN